jgi:GNAT superfamily N-acetyltransferase
MTGISISVSDTAAEADFEAIDRGFDQNRAGLFNIEPKICVFAHDNAGIFMGGAVCAVYGDAFLVKKLLVNEKQRGAGLGSRILAHCEQEAAARGCIRICLDTMSYQAPEFYRKLGFREKGTIRDFYAGHDRIFFEKRLRGMA